MFRSKESEDTDERNRHGRVYAFADGQYRYADQNQELEKRQPDVRQPGQQPVSFAKKESSFSENERDIFERAKKVTVKNRLTQTPIREVVNEEVQYEEEDTYTGKQRFLKNRMTAPSKELAHDEYENDHLPFSTIKK